MKMVTYVVLEDGDIVGLFQTHEKAVEYADKWAEQCYEDDWDVCITIERRLYTPEEIREIQEEL